jgi:DHA2 family multidrug resistance protein
VLLLITCTLVTTLYATTITIANVSLPQIQGALSASPDQIAWIVTANLIATAVTIPLAGWISDRFGRRRCMLWGTVGFGIATLLCGLSTSLTELIIWRVVQSAFGSPLTPISQSVVIDEFPGEKRGVAIAIYSMGVGVAPTLAPLIGGYVSEEISWRWVFFILIPIAVIALVGVLAFIKPDPPREGRPRLDWTGFLSLAICVACIQLMLDRGEREDWFDSPEIILEFMATLVFGWIFLVHSFTAKGPFIDLRLFLERNFLLGIGITTVFGMLFVTPMVMIPAMIQQLRDVPEFTSGLLISARSLGTMLAQVLMIAFAHRWDPRPLFLIGFGTHTYAGWAMIDLDMNAPLPDLAWMMVIQGFGVGCLWVPMTLVTFSNFDPRRSAEGMAIFHFMRSIASSYYISVSFIVVFHTQKIAYSDLVHWINPFSERLRASDLPAKWNADTTPGLASLADEVGRQATAIGYINSFHLFLWISMIAYPLIALIIWPPKGYQPPD